MSNPIYIIVSQENGKPHTYPCYATNVKDAKRKLKEIAMSALTAKLGKELRGCPLNDTIPIDKIGEGIITIRWRDENDKKIIELFEISKSLLRYKTKNILSTFEMVQVPEVTFVVPVLAEETSVPEAETQPASDAVPPIAEEPQPETQPDQPEQSDQDQPQEEDDE